MAVLVISYYGDSTMEDSAKTSFESKIFNCMTCKNHMFTKKGYYNLRKKSYSYFLLISEESWTKLQYFEKSQFFSLKIFQKKFNQCFKKF